MIRISYVKAEGEEIKEYLHTEFVSNPIHELKDFDKPYFDDATHILVNERIPFDEQMGKDLTRRFATYLKRDFNWTYPPKNPYEDSSKIQKSQ